MSIEVEVYCEECGRKFSKDNTICRGCFEEAQDTIRELEKEVEKLEKEIERLSNV